MRERVESPLWPAVNFFEVELVAVVLMEVRGQSDHGAVILTKAQRVRPEQFGLVILQKYL
ncbi:hypothetical protein LRY58_02530 [Candidatus Woesebacteria bacterium]|nr:hypothetical protein [Candidatus Woesebacteria bacterium]